MKTPKLDLEKVTDALLRHGEKIVVAIIGVASLLLAWWGLDAMRSLSVNDSQTPQAITQAANQAGAHIDREQQAPADLLPPRTPLADTIDHWRTPLVPWNSGATSQLTVAQPPAVAVLDNPLFEELAKRTKPTVLPVEDLRAVAGIAVLAAAAPQEGPGGVPRAPTPPTIPPAKPKPGGARRPARGGDPLAGGIDGAPVPASGPAGAVEPGRIVPYVVVTGLIPAAKQAEEYRRRFESCGFRDPRRDAPLWCDYEIERATVGPDGKENWSRIDLAAIAKRQAPEGGAGDAGGVAPEFRLSATEDARSKQSTPLDFCAPLPRRLDGTWELADLHPWVVDRLAEKLVPAGAPQEPAVPQPVDAVAGADGPGFGAAEERVAAEPGVQAEVQLPEYRLFRFVDTDVQPGATYRYRVRLKVWNPNYDKNPERMRPHLEDPALAVEPKISSPASAASTAATVPGTTRILVGPLRREELKELKIRPESATVEVLVLAPTANNATFTLRGLVADPGAVVNVDEKLNLKSLRDRARGEKTTTGYLLVDARGRQQDRRDGPAEREKPPGAIPEPLDVICVRPDGSFELATLADSERLIDAYGATLPPRSLKSDAKEPGAAEGFRGEPAFDPLARPGAPR